MKVKRLLCKLLLVIGLFVMVPDITAQAETKYTITYKPNGGSGSQKTNKVTSGSKHTFRANTTFKRTGYTLSKWNTKKTGKGTTYKCGQKVTIKKDITVYAIWTANSYTVNFDSTGGTGVAGKTVTYASTYGDLVTPARTGYTFLGWFTEASGGIQVTAGTQVTTASNHTLYAHWQVNNYIVSFHSMGGSGVADKVVTYTSSYGDLPTPTATGYTFLGWYTAPGGGAQVTAGTQVTTASNHTLYARWSENSYTIQYDKNDSTGIAQGTMDAHRQQYSQAISLKENQFTKKGYHFDRWNTKPDGTGTSYQNKAAVSRLGAANNQVITLYAIWVADEYTFSFDMNGGNGTKIEDKVQSYNATLQLPYCSYMRDGYEFVEWNTQADGKGVSMQNAVVGVKWELAQYADRNYCIKLYAIWRPLNYYIYFNLDEDAEMTDEEQQKEVTYDQEVGELPIPERKYYKFTGWCLEDGTKVSSDTIYKYANDIDVYDTWELQELTIHFDTNGGYLEDASKESVKLSALSSLGNMPVAKRAGYKFDGWYRVKDGKKTKITKDTKLGADMTLVAQWKKVSKPKKGVSKLKAKRKSGGKEILLTIKMPKNASADGYKIQYSTKANFKKKNTKTQVIHTKITKTKKIKLKKLSKTKKYYVRVCVYNKDSEGKLKQTAWKKITVK